MNITFRVVAWLLVGGGLVAACGDQASPHSKTPLNEKEVVDYSSRGQEIAAATFGELSGQLLEAIKQGGVPSAIKYCNIAALALTDSMSQKQDVQIQRISDQYRNPKNKPNSWQAEVLEAYRSQMEQGKALSPEIRRFKDGSIVFMSPIITQSLCLKCHGNPDKDISTETLQTLEHYYPNDRAKGFKEGDLRGIWSIRFEESES